TARATSPPPRRPAEAIRRELSASHSPELIAGVISGSYAEARRDESYSSHINSHVETDRAHQREAVALRYRAVAQRVVERHASVLELFLEVNVTNPPARVRGELGEAQIVRRDQADRAAVEERAQHAFGADAPIVRVRALQQLVEQ